MSCAVLDALSSLAVMVAVTSAVTGFPVMGNVAWLAPGGILISSGTVITPAWLLLNFTVKPDSYAGTRRDIFPVTDSPAFMLG